jgi:DNA damage-binding protein 1
LNDGYAQVSPACTITYLTTQIVYLGSHLGDSQLLRIHSSPADSAHNHIISISPDIPVIAPSRINTAILQDDDEFDTGTSNGQVIESTGTYVTVLQTFKNIAPIADAVLADLNGNGQEYIVTCSGGKNTGSLNMIRNGAGFKELAVIAGIHGVTDIWPIRTQFEERFVSVLLCEVRDRSHTYPVLTATFYCLQRMTHIFCNSMAQV